MVHACELLAQYYKDMSVGWHSQQWEKRNCNQSYQAVASFHHAVLTLNNKSFTYNLPSDIGCSKVTVSGEATIAIRYKYSPVLVQAGITRTAYGTVNRTRNILANRTLRRQKRCPCSPVDLTHTII